MLVTGDCLELLGTIQPGSVKLFFADPPYNIGISYGGSDPADDLLPDERYLGWCLDWIRQGAHTLTEDGSMWVMCDPRYAGGIQTIMNLQLHYRETIIWKENFGTYCRGKFGKDHRVIFRYTKNARQQVFHPDLVPSARLSKYSDKRANPKGRIPSNVWEFPRVCGTFSERIKEVPTQLPLALVRRIVRTASDPGDLVLDPFTGSGTTWIAALEHGCRFIGFELHQRYAAVACARAERFHAKEN